MFINPLEVLGVDPTGPPEPGVIKKARRRLLVEVQLAGDEIEIGGTTYVRSDLVRVLGELDDPGKVRGFHALRHLPALTQFLRTGDPAYFRDGQTASQQADEALARAISPHFAKRIGKVLARALREGDEELVRKITARAPLVPPTDRPLALRPIDTVLGEIKKELETLQEQLRTEELDPEDAATQVRLLVTPDALNVLPPQYTTVRGQIARMMRNLAVISFNVHDAVKPAYVLLSSAARLTAPADVGDDIAKQLAVLSEARDALVLQERYEAEIARCTEMMVAVYSIIEEVDQREIGPSEACAQARAQVRTDFLTRLPDELGETMTQIALTLRSLSVSIWNEFQDAEAAISVLDHALTIRLKSEIKEQLSQDRATLFRLLEDEKMRIASEKADLRKLRNVVQSMSQPLLQHRGDQIRWNVVAERVSELFSHDLVEWLAAMKQHARREVVDVISSLVPILAGLANLFPRGYEQVIGRLHAVLDDDPQLMNLVSRSAVTERVAQDPALRRATNGPAIWEQAWFWWVVVIGLLVLLGQCGA